jgi:hypothetical protein
MWDLRALVAIAAGTGEKYRNTDVSARQSDGIDIV